MLQTSFPNLREYGAPQRAAVFAWLALQILNGSAVWSQQSETPKDAPVSRAEAKISDRLHEAFLREVTDYEFSLDAENRQKLALRREPVMRFTAGPHDFQGEDLRLLPQPLYRYEPTDKDTPVIDGALFAYVWTGGALDPEVFLVIEAVRAPGGASWQFAPARFTNREATVKHQGKLVWRADADSPRIFDGVTTKRYGVFSVKTIAVGPGE